MQNWGLQLSQSDLVRSHLGAVTMRSLECQQFPRAWKVWLVMACMFFNPFYPMYVDIVHVNGSVAESCVGEPGRGEE